MKFSDSRNGQQIYLLVVEGNRVGLAIIIEQYTWGALLHRSYVFAISSSKHLKGRLGPRVSDAFWIKGGQLGSRVSDAFWIKGGRLGSRVSDVFF